METVTQSLIDEEIDATEKTGESYNNTLEKQKGQNFIDGNRKYTVNLNEMEKIGKKDRQRSNLKKIFYFIHAEVPKDISTLMAEFFKTNKIHPSPKQVDKQFLDGHDVNLFFNT
jgi:hypothetical protein